MPTIAVKPTAVWFALSELYFLLRDTITSRPIARISTIDRPGWINLAPFSFLSARSPWLPAIGFFCGPGRDDYGGTDLCPRRHRSTFARCTGSLHLLAALVATVDDLTSLT